MKRIVSVFLTLVMSFSMFANIASAEVEVLDPDAQYEFWTMAPYLTTNIGQEEFRIFKAMQLDKLLMYPVEGFGDRYYFAIAEAQFSDSGVNGRSKLSELYCYLLLTTDDGFIIIDSCCCWSSYYWDAGVNIEDISDKVTTPSKGSKVKYMITPNSKYSTTDWDDYNDYIFLTEDKRMTMISENNSVRQGGWPVVRNGKMYWGKDYQSNGKKYTIDYVDAMMLTELYFENGQVEHGTAGKVLMSEVTEANGYTVYKTLQPELQKISVYKIPESDRLYFQTLNYPVYNESGAVVTYNDKIEILKNDNGKLRIINTYTFDSGNRYQTSYAITELKGTDVGKYKSEGKSIPVIDIGKKYLITSTGQVVKMSLNTSIYTNWNYALYNGKVVIIRYQNGSQYIYDGGYKQALNYLTIDSRNNINLSSDIILPQVYAPNEGQNGYYSGGATFNACTTFTRAAFSSSKEWWGRSIDNVFDDGRVVTCDWGYIGNYYEIWYTVTGTDGKVRAHGATGYTRESSKAEKDLFCIAIGNSKFMVGTLEVNSGIVKEFYLTSVVKETGDGNVVSNVSLGNKTLTPPANTDTVPVQSIINFGEDNLPIGYNIKDNVVGTNKLDSAVRERINAIRLNDIVIVKNSETASGTQNTGISLNGFETYDSAMGNSAIRVYTNGQNFCWYVGEVSDLNTGTYNRNYTIGDKVIYVTYKIVEAPGNTGVTTVVF